MRAFVWGKWLSPLRNPVPPVGTSPSIGDGRVARRSAVLRIVATVALLVTLASTGRTQEVTGPALKAAFLFNFVKFTTWPADVLADGAPVQMCVMNAPALGNALSEAVQGRAVAGHPIQVSQPVESAALRRCHVLFVAGPRAAALRAVATVRDVPVLTVSDVPAFTTEGGIVQFHVQQGQLRFAVGLEAARTARLQISSKLLSLARQP